MEHYLTWFNFLTVLILVATLALVKSRIGGVGPTKFDTSWPLFYYAGLVFYTRSFEGEYENYFIFAGILAALFLRFEFLGGLFLKVVRTVELVALGYVLLRGSLLLLSGTR